MPLAMKGASSLMKSNQIMKNSPLSTFVRSYCASFNQSQQKFVQPIEWSHIQASLFLHVASNPPTIRAVQSWLKRSAHMLSLYSINPAEPVNLYRKMLHLPCLSCQIGYNHLCIENANPS